MYRKSGKYTGVYQRCTAKCPADRCRTHKWTYIIELPPTPEDSRPQVTKGGYKDAKEASEARAEVLSLHRRGELPIDRKTLFGDWLDTWFEAKIGRGELEESTQRCYSDQIRDYLRPKLGDRKVGELRGWDFTRVYQEVMQERAEVIAEARATNARHAADAEKENARRRAAGRRRMLKPAHVPVPRPVSAATVHRIHAIVSGSMKSAVRAGLTARNFAQDAELPKIQKKKVRPPTPEVYGAMLDSIAHERLYAFILVAGHSGLRRGELAGMRWNDIDMATGRIVVGLQRTIVGYRVVEKVPKSEAGEDRIVYLDRGTLRELRVWQRLQAAERQNWTDAYQDSDYVFTRQDGKAYHPDYLTKVYRRLATKAGLRTTRLHGMRHFRASALISSGADISAVSKEMGHSTIAVTNDIYGHLFEKASKANAKRAAKLVPRQGKPVQLKKVKKSKKSGDQAVNAPETGSLAIP